MGTYKKGILGAFSGKVGTVVGATWRGKDVMRSLPRRGNRAATQIQMMQRDKFTMASDFLTPLNPVVSRYFGSNSGEKTRRNQAMSYLMKEALVYVEPDLYWDFSKVLISKGDLLGLNLALASTGANQSVNLTWSDNSGQGIAEPTDKLVVVVYEETSKTVAFSLMAGTRTAEAATVAVPAFLSGLTVQVWATFASVNDKQFATSQYLGTVVIG